METLSFSVVKGSYNLLASLRRTILYGNYTFDNFRFGNWNSKVMFKKNNIVWKLGIVLKSSKQPVFEDCACLRRTILYGN